MYRCKNKECNWEGCEIFEHGVSPCCPECGGDIERIKEDHLKESEFPNIILSHILKLT